MADIIIKNIPIRKNNEDIDALFESDMEYFENFMDLYRRALEVIYNGELRQIDTIISQLDKSASIDPARKVVMNLTSNTYDLLNVYHAFSDELIAEELERSFNHIKSCAQQIIIFNMVQTIREESE